MKAVDWIARTAMLVLASLATLALIGSLASVSNSALGDAFPGTIATPLPDIAPGGASSPDSVPTAPGTASGDASTATAVRPAPTPGETEIARWLKALTYAVLALAAVAAAGVVALARIASHLGRLADR